jgi:glyoxylase-like metal-dependent hydrolase (beta-lactamase superfamily II)
MQNYICSTCGTQHAASERPPAGCAICEDERQYVGWNGQQWTTLDELRAKYSNEIRADLGLTGIGTRPAFAIGQRALLIPSAEGNVLWDCITVIDEDTIAAVRRLGGLRGIAISHPHYYACMVEWAEAFDAKIYLHAADRKWVMRPDDRIEFWSGETRPLWDDMTLIRSGGHFSGGQVLHWPAGADGRGALFAGDLLMVGQDRRWVSFMYSFPNYIPLPASEVDRVAGAVESFNFDRIYGAWWERNVISDGKAAVQRSAERYKLALTKRLGSG